MNVYERGQFTPQMWGKDQIVLTVEDIAALLKGKKLWTTVCGEYAVEIIWKNGQGGERMTDDLISRQAAIELCDWYEHDFSECDYAIKALADDLKNLPTAEKKGKWISDSKQRLGQAVEIDDDGFPTDSCHCSVCGDWLTASDEYAVRGRYCPNCGARMEE